MSLRARNARAVRPQARGTMRRGLTLIELVVALTIGGLVLLATQGVFSGLSDAKRSVAMLSERTTRENGGERLLRNLVLGVGADGGLLYRTSGDTLRFESWCPTPYGWLERCRVMVGVDSGLFVAFGAFHERLDGARHSTELLFLQSSENGGRWRSVWTDTLQLPQAVGVVRRASERVDTLILRIGTRG